MRPSHRGKCAKLGKMGERRWFWLTELSRFKWPVVFRWGQFPVVLHETAKQLFFLDLGTGSRILKNICCFLLFCKAFFYSWSSFLEYNVERSFETSHSLAPKACWKSGVYRENHSPPAVTAWGTGSAGMAGAQQRLAWPHVLIPR